MTNAHLKITYTKIEVKNEHIYIYITYNLFKILLLN